MRHDSLYGVSLVNHSAWHPLHPLWFIHYDALETQSCVTWLMHLRTIILQRHESCHTYEWVSYPLCDMTHLSTHHHSPECGAVNVWHESCHTYEWVSHPLCDMTHLHVWHDSFTRVTWRTHLCIMTHLRNLFWVMAHNDGAPWVTWGTYGRQRPCTHNHWVCDVIDLQIWFTPLWISHTCVTDYVTH